jgi:hypothetical protein
MDSSPTVTESCRCLCAFFVAASIAQREQKRYDEVVHRIQLDQTDNAWMIGWLQDIKALVTSHQERQRSRVKNASVFLGTFLHFQ